MMRTTLALVILTLAGTSAFAQTTEKKKPAEPAATTPAAPPAMQAPAPAPEVADAAKKMSGTWKCKGSSMWTGQTIPVEGTMNFKLDPSKFWIVGMWKGKKTKENPMAMTSTEYRTYDASQKKWVSVGIDSMGGWSTMSSPGPDADGKAVWDGKSGMVGMNGQMITS